MELEEKVSMEDWPMFGRNPQHTAYYPGKINPKRLKLKWRIKVEKPWIDWLPYSLVVIDNITYFYNHAFDTETGRELPFEGKISPYSVKVDNTLYKISKQGLLAMDKDTGKEQWRFRAEFPEIEASPAIALNKIIFGIGNNFYALNTKTGREEWKFTLPFKKVRCWSISPSVENSLAFFSTDNEVYALNTENGKKAWLFEVKSKYNYPRSWYFPPPLAVANGIVYFGSVEGGRYGDCSNYWLHALDAETGKEKWVFKTKGECGIAQPVVTNNTVIFGSNKLYILNENGKKIKKIKVKGYVDAIAIAKNAIYVGSNKVDTFLYAFCERN